MTQLTVSIVVVEHGHAGLGVPVELGLLPVVGLRQPQAPGAGPPVEAASGVGRGHRDLVSGGVVTSTDYQSVIITWLADQNQPLMFLGKRSGLSHPSKSQRRPEVQKYGTLAAKYV